MTTHIETATTEVIAEPEASAAAGSGGSDSRWSEQQKIAAVLKRSECMNRRLRAEGFDD